MSDLQCPATVLVLRGDAPADLLQRHRVAGVVTSGARTTTAERVAGSVGAPVVRRELAGDTVTTLEELADLHRGETLLVVAEDDVADALLTRLLGRVAAGTLRARPVVELAVDADGWVLRSVADPQDAIGG